MTVLALDPSFRATGFAVARGRSLELIAAGCIRTKKAGKKRRVLTSDDDTRCCLELAQQLLGLVERHDVRAIVAELPAGSKGARANRCLGYSIGVLSGVIAQLALPVEWYSPAEVKRAAASSSSASKLTVTAGVLLRWPGVKIPEYKAEREAVSDALAVLMAAEQNGNLVRMLPR